MLCLSRRGISEHTEATLDEKDDVKSREELLKDAIYLDKVQLPSHSLLARQKVSEGKLAGGYRRL
jgi:hypothetical protein